MTQKNIWMWSSIGILCMLILASYLSIHYYMEYTKYQQLYSETLTELRKYDEYIFVRILIDYGNETKDWHNNTLIARGADLLNATRTVSEVDYDIWENLGALVTHINTVGGEPNTYWLWYIWNSTSSSWDFGLEASDAHILQEGDIVAWIYTKF